MPVELTVREPLVLGLDLGTSAVKVVAVGAESGAVAGVGTAAYPTYNPLPEQAEQDPADWMRATQEALRDLDRVLTPATPDWRGRTAAIGVAGQLPTLVCLGTRGALGRAITWKDARADGATAASLDAAQRRAIYRQTGMPLDGRYLGPMFRHHWLARRDQIVAILSAKDYLVLELTGERVTDPSTAAGYGVFDLQAAAFSPSLCELWQMPLDMLPPVRAAHSQAGALTAQAAQTLGVPVGIPVSVGAADSVSSAFAMTGLEEGAACITMGSSTIIIDAVRAARWDPTIRYLLTPHVEPGWYGREMDLLATGTGYRWLSDLLGLAPGMLDQRAANSPPGARGLVFTPYLAGGEQGALWNSALRGSISGLTLQHDANDLARAFLEGVCFEIRRCLEVLADTTPIRSVVVAGHLTEQPASLQMLADILGRPVQTYLGDSPAALGAALGALQLIGRAAPVRAHSPPVLPREDYGALFANYLAKTHADTVV
ncbi:MAG: hypothetical protein JSR66_11790 [Proteobacteria bacterium]|nr:hypothetical protein [Pseudomonadota bacterium]